MTPREIFSTIYDTLYALWASETPAMNGGTAPPLLPDDVDARPPESGVWARITAEVSRNTQESMGEPGGRRFEAAGFFTVDVFTPANEGYGKNGGYGKYDFCDVVRRAFQGKTVSGIRFSEIQGPLPAGEEDSWKQTRMVVSYDHQYDV